MKNVTYSFVFKRTLILSLIFAILVSLFPSSLLYGLTEEQRKLYQSGIGYYDLDSCDTAPPSGDQATTNSVPLPSNLRDKIGKLMFVGSTNSKSDMVEVVKKYKIGGVMLTNESTALYSKAAISELKEASGSSLLIASDEEGGLVQRLKSQTDEYPNAKSLGGKSEKEIESIAKEYGKKLADLGVNVNYAPVVDIDDGKNSIISDTKRSFSDDPEEITKKAGAFAEGMRASGVTPVFKHFPGHGRADGDSHVDVVKTPSLSALKQSDLKPYETLLKSDSSGVMMGHLVVPGLTESSEYKQTSINKAAYDLLRNDYSFDGVVFTDEIANMQAINKNYPPDEAVALAIRAGADMPLFNHNPSLGSIDAQVKKMIDKVEDYVKSNKISEADIDSSLARISKLNSNTVSNNETSVSENCACLGKAATTALSGGSNEAKVWNYFAAKDLSPKQIAGIMGNMKQESGFDPENIQNPAGRTKDPAPIGGSVGWGLIQWTPGNKIIGLAKTAKVDGPIYELSTQLDLVWKHFQNDPVVTQPFNLEEFKKMDTTEQTTTYFHDKIEGSADKGMGTRIGFANDFLSKFGSGGSGSSSGDSNTPDASTNEADCDENNASASTGDGKTKGDFIWPIKDKKYGSQGSTGMCWKGPRSGGRLHGGLDMGALFNPNLSALAVDGGTVESASVQSGFGNNIVIKHDGGLWTQYSHLASMDVKAGDKVSQGQKIGVVGATGGDYPIHLHFQVHKKGGVVSSVASETENPLDFLPKDGRPTGACVPGNQGYKG